LPVLYNVTNFYEDCFINKVSKTLSTIIDSVTVDRYIQRNIAPSHRPRGRSLVMGYRFLSDAMLYSRMFLYYLTADFYALLYVELDV